MSSREPDVDEREVRQPGAERGQRIGTVAVRGDLVALLAQDVGVVGADRGLVLDDGDTTAHGRSGIAGKG